MNHFQPSSFHFFLRVFQRTFLSIAHNDHAALGVALLDCIFHGHHADDLDVFYAFLTLNGMQYANCQMNKMYIIKLEINEI